MKFTRDLHFFLLLYMAYIFLFCSDLLLIIFMIRFACFFNQVICFKCLGRGAVIFILGGIRGAGLKRGGARARQREGGTVIEGGFFVFGLRDFFGLF